MLNYACYCTIFISLTCVYIWHKSVLLVFMSRLFTGWKKGQRISSVSAKRAGTVRLFTSLRDRAFLKTLEDKISRGDLLKVQLYMGRLWERSKPLPFYNPVCFPSLNCHKHPLIIIFWSAVSFFLNSLMAVYPFLVCSSTLTWNSNHFEYVRHNSLVWFNGLWCTSLSHVLLSSHTD